MTNIDKEKILNELKSNLLSDESIEKIIIFGSFTNSDSPNDIDVALFSNSNEDYLTIVMRYKKLIRNTNIKIPVDIIPVSKKTDKDSLFLK